MSKDIKQVIKTKTGEMSRMTPFRAALLKAIEPKQERPKVKKAINVSVYEQRRLA